MRDLSLSYLVPLVTTAVEAVGYVFWGMTIQPAGRQVLLRVYIDKAQGVTVDDCAIASIQITAVLAVNGYATTQYSLEVSSPGLDRALFTPAQYAQYKNQTIKLSLKKAHNSQRNFQGIIENIDLDRSELTLKILSGQKSEKYIFQFDCIDSATVVPDF